MPVYSDTEFEREFDLGNHTSSSGNGHGGPRKLTHQSKKSNGDGTATDKGKRISRKEQLHPDRVVPDELLQQIRDFEVQLSGLHAGIIKHMDGDDRNVSFHEIQIQAEMENQDVREEARLRRMTRDLELPPAVDINDLEDEDADYLVAGYLQLGTAGYLVAKYGAGKSFLALDWACCVATGRKWLERETTMGKVIYVAAEGAGGQSKRAEAWKQENEDIPDGIVTVLKKPIQLGNTKHVDHLVKLVIEHKASLVIIDTLARSMLGLDESKDGAIITAALDRIRDAWGERMTTVLVVHHLGKDASRGARGDSRFIADADFNYTMEKDKITGCITLSCDKLKEDEPPADIGLRLRKVQLDKWGKRTSCVLYGVELADDDDQLVAWIRDHPNLGSGAIATARGGNRQNLSARLTRLQREGRIRDEEPRKNRNSWVAVTQSAGSVPTTVAHDSQ